MDWIRDFIETMWGHGIGGIFLLGVAAFFALAAIAGLLVLVGKALGFAGDLGRAAGKGWREGDS